MTIDFLFGWEHAALALLIVGESLMIVALGRRVAAILWPHRTVKRGFYFGLVGGLFIVASIAFGVVAVLVNHLRWVP